MATHHYIPQFLLKRFASASGREGLTVWDKVEDRIFHPKVKDFGIEEFHTFTPHEEWPPSGSVDGIEQILNELFEEPAAPLIERIIKMGTLHLNEEERLTVIAFIALQFVRTPGFFRRGKTFTAASDEDVPRLLRVTGTPQKPQFLRNITIGSIVDETFGLTPVLRRAHLALLSADEDLLIGDDPVVIQPPPGMPENLKTTFTVSKPRHDAFLPISPRHVLYLHTDADAKVGTVGRTLEEPHPLNSVGFEFLNRLQVQNAVRYVVLNDAAQRDLIFPMLNELEQRFFLFRNLFDK